MARPTLAANGLHVAEGMPMSTYPLDPGRSRSKNVKLAAVGATVLLLAGLGALAYVGVASQGHAGAAVHAAAPARATVAIGTVSGAPGVPVEVPVSLAGASSLGSVTVQVAYDPKVVTFDDARPGPIEKSQLTWRHDESQGLLILLLATSQPGGFSGEDPLAVLTFTAKGGAVGQLSTLTVTVRDAVHADGTEAAVDASSGSFRNGIPGDVNGDGKVDLSDYDLLARYLVGDPVTIVPLNADLNGDGKVTEADAVLLLQKLDAQDGATHG
jgi:hypothetical protein